MNELSFHEALVWSEDGHLSDLAISALSDEQSHLLSLKARQHLDECSDCAERMVAFMVTTSHLELEMGFAFTEVSALSESLIPSEAKSPFPAHWFMIVSVGAAFGVSPLLRNALLRAPAVLRESGADLLSLVNAVSLLRHHSPFAGTYLAVLLATLAFFSLAILQKALSLHSKETTK